MPEQDDSIDALNAMAAGANTEQPDPADERDPEDALAAMAAGEDLSSQDPEVQEAIASTVADDDEVVDPAALERRPAASASVADKKARAAAYQKHASRAQAHQFKQVMIPLLIVVGAILFLLATVALVMVLRANNPSTLAIVAVIASYPMGSILLLGAWYFHRDVARAKR